VRNREKESVGSTDRGTDRTIFIYAEVNKNMAKKKKWGKMGAPKSAKRKAWMRRISKKR
jgi:hypothetical protein